MAEKQTNKERLKDITDSIERGIQDLFQSDKYAEYLRTMSRFHKYSVNNQMLIYMQKPNATLVAGFNKWRDQFERNVMKGEKGIKIIAPTPFKKKIEQEKRDPDTNLPMLDADGKVIIEEKEIKIPMYKPVTVFDVSQTEGKPLPQLASDLSGNVQNYEVFLEALRRSAPVYPLRCWAILVVQHFFHKKITPYPVTSVLQDIRGEIFLFPIGKLTSYFLCLLPAAVLGCFYHCASFS